MLWPRSGLRSATNSETPSPSSLVGGLPVGMRTGKLLNLIFPICATMPWGLARTGARLRR